MSVLQPRTGYRINVDAFLLAAFAASQRLGPVARVVDLGAGVGGVVLALNHFVGVRRADLVEREPQLAALAKRNLAAHHIEGEVHVTDLASDGLPKTLRAIATDVVVNPPFFPVGTSRPQQQPAQRRARSGRLMPFLSAAAAAVGRRGKVYFIYPAGSLARLLGSAEQCGLVAKRLRFVHPFPHAAARVSLVELSHAKPGGLIVEPALFEWSSRGVRSPEVSELLRGRAIDRK